MGGVTRHQISLTFVYYAEKTLFQRNNFAVNSHMIGKMLDHYSKNLVL
jgi:hypothetical protein